MRSLTVSSRLTAVMCSIVLLPGTQPSTQSQPVSQQASAPAAESTKIPPDQLDSLVAPIALYPDPMLAQTLAASTYPLEIITLQQWLEKNKNLKDKALADAVAKQPWDPSIQALAGLPDVVKRLADDIQWATDLGNAFLAQQSDVMDAVQRMRKKAESTGNLKSNEQQKVETKVIENKSVIVVEQANPQVVYVPSYNPTVVYGPPVYPYPPIYYPPPPPPGAYLATAAISFGVGVAMGAMWGGGWGWGCGWGHNDVNVNVNNNFNRNTNISGGNRTNISGGNRASQLPAGGRGGGAGRPGGVGGVGGAGGVGGPGGVGGVGGAGGIGGVGGGNRVSTLPSGGGDRWQHNPEHRGGAPYKDRATADRFGGTTRGDSLSKRQASARQQVGRQGGNLASTRGGASVSNRAGSNGFGNRGGTGVSNRASGGGADRIGSRDLSRSGGGNRDGFGGGSRGYSGSSARSSSSRGSSSMGSRGGGGFGGGGRRGGGGGRRR